jgi:hypothetical protein
VGKDVEELDAGRVLEHAYHTPDIMSGRECSSRSGAREDHVLAR